MKTLFDVDYARGEELLIPGHFYGEGAYIDSRLILALNEEIHGLLFGNFHQPDTHQLISVIDEEKLSAKEMNCVIKKVNIGQQWSTISLNHDNEHILGIAGTGVTQFIKSFNFNSIRESTFSNSTS